jgi:hypothetical protein
MLTQKQKNAIENLLILASYIKDNSIYSDEYEKIINKSIRVTEELIGKRKVSTENDKEMVELMIEEMKKRFEA